MTLIQFKKNGGVVSIELDINSPTWSYEYAGDITFRNNSGNSTSPQKPMLGHPADLDNDINAREIRLAKCITISC